MPYPMTAIAAWLAGLEERVALLAHLADKAHGREGVPLEQLDEALDKIDASERSLEMWL